MVINVFIFYDSLKVDIGTKYNKYRIVFSYKDIFRSGLRWRSVEKGF